MSKLRSKQQKFGEIAKIKLQEVLTRFCNVNELNPDYGFDFNVHLMGDDQGGVEPISDQSFYAQSKSIFDSGSGPIYEDLKVSDWELFSSQHIPVVVFKFDSKNNIFYWEIVQTYVSDVLNREDPNWRRQTKKRLNFSKKLDDSKLFKQAVIEAQARITRKGYLNLDLGEGITVIGDDLEELRAHRDREILASKAKSLLLFHYQLKQGKEDEAHQELMTAYSSPGEDIGKVKAIIALVSECNPTNHEENIRSRQLADEGIALASKLKLIGCVNYLKIQQCEAELYEVMSELSRLFLAQKIANSTAIDFISSIYGEEQGKLWSEQKRITERINQALKELLANNFIYYYNASLLIVLRCVSFQIGHLAIFDKSIIQDEEARAPLISQCEFILKNLSDQDMKKLLFKELANYYYHIQQFTKALEYIENAIAQAAQDNDSNSVNGYSHIRDLMKSRPDPYTVPTTKSIDQMSIEELKGATKLFIKTTSPEMPQHLQDAILNDVDPQECFRHCSHLRVAYLTNMAGRIIGVPSIGGKIIWCKYGAALQGMDHYGTLELFKQIKCSSCKYHDPRPSGWSCNVAWINEQLKDPEFAEFLKKYRENQHRS